MICTGASYPLLALVLYVNMKPFVRSCTKKAVLIPGLLIALGLVFVFARTPLVIVVKPMLFASIGYSGFIFKMMRDYISLVSKKMTFKERLTRKRSQKELHIENDILKEEITRRKALQNHYKFFCKRKIPKSYI